MYNTPKHVDKYKAYAAANMTVGKTRQVVMLYDGAMRFVQQAIEAIKKEDYETRYNLLVKTSEIITGLQNSLDFENGGDIAKLLYDYYASIDARLFSVHRSNNIALLESVIKELRMMRDAWHEIDQADSAKKQTEHEALRPVALPSGASSPCYSSVGVSA